MRKPNVSYFMHLREPKRLALLVLLSIALFAVATATYADKKRREPARVPPVELDGVRYEAVLLGTPYGYRQDGGIIVARDAASSRLMWTHRIYSIDYDDSIEEDKQDVFIAAMTPVKDGKCLLITNERGEQFELRLSTRVTRKARQAGN